MTMLIDTREPARQPEPSGRRRVVEPDWRLWSWIAACVVLCAAASTVPGALGVVLVLAGFAAACKSLDVFLGPYSGGLTEWQQ